MKFLDPRAIKDWIKSRAVNSMMATEKGFFMDARQGPVIREELDDIQTGLNEINSKLFSLHLLGTASTLGSFTMPDYKKYMFLLFVPTVVDGMIAGCCRQS